MKKFGYFIYFVIILILGFFFLTLGNEAAKLAFYNTTGSEALETQDYDEYIKSYMNYSSFFEYRKDPLYMGTSSDENFAFDFVIMQSYLETDDISAVLNHFYFIDHLESYDHLFLDQESVDLFSKNAKLAVFQLELLMEGETEPTLTPIEIFAEDGISNYENKVKVKPLALTYNHLEENEPYFKYITFDDEENVVWNMSKTIKQIEIYFADYTKVESINDDPRKVKLLTLTHNENANFTAVDYFVDNDGVKEATNFNGNINNYLNTDNFTNEEEEKAGFSDLIKPYRNVRNKWLFIYVGVALVISYLIFFLNPTIKYFKDKRHKKSLRNFPKKKPKTKRQIFSDDD